MASKIPKVKRLKRAYYQPKAGEWVRPIPRGYRLACCDCGLVHLMNFRIKDGRAEFAVFRGNRQTASIRAAKPHPFVPAEYGDAVAARLLKVTRKKSITVGKWKIKLRAVKVQKNG